MFWSHVHLLQLHIGQDLMDKYVWGDDKNDDANEGVGAMIADGVVGIMGMFADE